ALLDAAQRNPEVAGVTTSHGRPRRTRDAGFTMRSHWVRPTRGCSVTTGLRVLDRESRACRSILDSMVARVLAKDEADASGTLLLLDILGQAPRGTEFPGMVIASRGQVPGTAVSATPDHDLHPPAGGRGRTRLGREQEDVSAAAPAGRTLSVPPRRTLPGSRSAMGKPAGCSRVRGARRGDPGSGIRAARTVMRLP